MTTQLAATVATLKPTLLAFLERGHVSFAELMKEVPGFSGGDFEYVLEFCENIILWGGMTEAGCEAIRELKVEGKIHFEPAGPLVYLIDGAALKLPLVRRAVKYKKPHWLPVTISLGPAKPPKRKRS